MVESASLVVRLAAAVGFAVCLTSLVSRGLLDASTSDRLAWQSRRSDREYRSKQLVRRSSHFRLIHPRTLDPRDVENVLGMLESNRSELLQRVSSAGIETQLPELKIILNETTGDFVGRTGMPSWAAAATKSNRIELQPLKLLKQRRILETTLRHELVHVLIDKIGGHRTPRWLAEGMALYVAGEGRMLERYTPKDVTQPEAVEQMLANAGSASKMQTAYAAAYAFVKDLIRLQGESKVWTRLQNSQD